MDRRQHGTSGGVELSDELVARLAGEAEAGFEPGRLRARRGRPPIGSAAATVMQVRIEPELRESLTRVAGERGRSPSEIARSALRAYLLDLDGDHESPAAGGMSSARPAFGDLDQPWEPLLPPPAGQVERVAALVDELLGDQRVAASVSAFYDDAEGFAGRTFLGLAPNEPFAFGSADLVAVMLMGGSMSAAAVRALLPGGDLADLCSSLLARVPVGVPLWEATPTELGWANRLWHVLAGSEGAAVGWVKAGQLLARKRPELVPIVDRAVTTRLACERGTYWRTLQAVLDDSSRRCRVAGLYPLAPVVRNLHTMLVMRPAQRG